MRTDQPEHEGAVDADFSGSDATVEAWSWSLLVVGMVRGLCWYFGFALS